MSSIRTLSTSLTVDHAAPPRTIESDTVSTVPVRTPDTDTASCPSLVGRAERALVLLAHFIELDGDVHVPMYERLEAELQELKRRESTKERARKLLMSYSRPGGSETRAVAHLTVRSAGGSKPRA